MMRKLPDCPKCGEDELWLKHISFTVQLKCYLCGWSSGIVTPMAGQDLDAQIAATVAAAQDPVSAPIANSPE
jgi:uncharacterized protein (DUF983 family)